MGKHSDIFQMEIYALDTRGPFNTQKNYKAISTDCQKATKTLKSNQMNYLNGMRIPL